MASQVIPQTISGLTYCINALEAITNGRSIPPPGSQTPPLYLSINARIPHQRLLTLTKEAIKDLALEQEPLDLNLIETCKKARSIAQHLVVVSQQIKPHEKNRIKNQFDREFFSSLSTNPHTIIEILGSKDTNDLSITEIRALEQALYSLACEKEGVRNIAYSLTCEFLCISLLKQLENEGGHLKDTDRCSFFFDWEKINLTSPEATMIAARLQKAHQNRCLGNVFPSFLSDLESFDDETRHLLHLCAFDILSDAFDALDSSFVKVIESGPWIFEVGSDEYSSTKSPPPPLTKIGSEAFLGYERFIKERERTETSKPIGIVHVDEALDLRTKALRKIASITFCYRHKDEEFSKLYEKGYIVYQNALRKDKVIRPFPLPDILKSHLPTPDEYRQKVIPSISEEDLAKAIPYDQRSLFSLIQLRKEEMFDSLLSLFITDETEKTEILFRVLDTPHKKKPPRSASAPLPDSEKGFGSFLPKELFLKPKTSPVQSKRNKTSSQEHSARSHSSSPKLPAQDALSTQASLFIPEASVPAHIDTKDSSLSTDASGPSTFQLPSAAHSIESPIGQAKVESPHPSEPIQRSDPPLPASPLLPPLLQDDTFGLEKLHISSPPPSHVTPPKKQASRHQSPLTLPPEHAPSRHKPLIIECFSDIDAISKLHLPPFTEQKHVRNAYWERANAVIETEQDRWNILIHTYPRFIAPLIQTLSPKTSVYNERRNCEDFRYSCVGSLEEYGRGIPPVLGVFTESFLSQDCCDGKKGENFHHCFDVLHSAQCIENFVKHGSFAAVQSLHSLEPLPESQKKKSYLEIQKKYRITIHPPYTIIVDDTRDQIRWKMVFENPIQLDML